MNCFRTPNSFSKRCLPNYFALLLVATLGLLPCLLQAQAPRSLPSFDSVQDRRQTIERLDQTGPGRISVPRFYAGEDEDVGPQSLLLVRPRHGRFEAMVDSQYFYTGNMFLQESQPNNSPVPTGLLVNTAQSAVLLNLRPILGAKTSARAGYRHQWFLYGLEEHVPTLNAFNFNAGTVFAEVRSVWRDVWGFEAGIEYARLMSDSTYAEFYKDLAPRLAFRRTFSITESSALVASLESRYRFSDIDPRLNQPDRAINDRFDQTLTIGYSQLFWAKLVLQPFWRMQFSHFTQNLGRNDLLSSTGLSATWFFTPNMSFRLFGAYDLKESDDSAIPDYRKVDAGGGFNVSLRF